MFDTPKCHIFHWNLLFDKSASFTSSRMKDLCQKWKVKLIFWGAYSLSGTGVVECLEITDVRYNLKQFDGLIRLTLTLIFYARSTPLVYTTVCPRLSGLERMDRRHDWAVPRLPLKGRQPYIYNNGTTEMSLAVLTQCTIVTDRPTERQTDGQTDRQTDRQTTASMHYASTLWGA